jgi:hypothetical protein
MKPWALDRVSAVGTLSVSAALIALAVFTQGAAGHPPQTHAQPSPPRAAAVVPTGIPLSSAAAAAPADDTRLLAATPALTQGAGDLAAKAEEAEEAEELEALGLVDKAEPGPIADTPLEENDAAEHLARAWRAVLHRPARETTVAVLWAHWAHETARGQRMHGFNFGGIKGRGPAGASVVVWTREGARPGELVQRTFRAYDTARDGAYDYVALLRTRYPNAFRAARYGRVDEFVAALQAGGYFTADGSAYLRALTMLSGECRRRGISTAAVDRVRQNPDPESRSPDR